MQKSFFSRIGQASVKLGKGDQTGAIADFNQIAKDSREKDPEVLYRIGEALALYLTIMILNYRSIILIKQ